MLKFQKGNSKLTKNIYTFSLPAGWSCPSAQDCLSKSDPTTGKIQDGKHTQFRCFAASSESLFKNVRESRWHNFNLLTASKDLVQLISTSLPKKAQMIRVHVSGDFFNEKYFKAWMQVASLHPDKTFYAYTKSLGYWVNNLDLIPSNFKLTASEGGKQNNLIALHNLKYAKVVYSPEEAIQEGLEIDHDDSHAYNSDQSFALLLHGIQPAGSKASQALKDMKRRNISFSYTKKAKVIKEVLVA